jgi:putative ATP-binding cassette transporter
VLTSLRQIWRLTVLCAWRPGGRFGIVLFATIFGLGLAGVHVTVRLIRWANDFYTALQKLDVPAATQQMGVFFALVAVSASLNLSVAWLRKLLQIRWRQGLTGVVLDAWLSDKAYWHLRDRQENGLDNPDQRIADDCRIFVYRLTTEALELMTNVVALVSYVAILWSLSTFPLALSLFGIEISIARYMVWAAPLYVAVSSGVTHWLGKPLIPLNVEQQKTEADFRFALARLRENGEPVAFARGEQAERRLFAERFAAVADNWRRLMNRELVLGLFTRPYMQTVLRIPLFLALPAFLAGRLTFGGLMQIASTFQNVVTTLSWFIFSYRDLAELVATARRLDGFLADCGAVSRGAGSILRSSDAGGRMAMRDLSLAAPDGRVIVAIEDLAVSPGEVVWLSGASGRGKTTLARTLAALWVHGEGHVTLPAGPGLFLSQQSYLPLGSVADAVAYPSPRDDVGDEAILAALGAVGLDRLAEANRLDLAVAQAGLSGGERQRLMLARLIIHQPSWAVLDEPTSALDREAEAAVFAAVRALLPATALLIIAHRAPQGLGPVRRVDLDEVRPAQMRVSAA